MNLPVAALVLALFSAAMWFAWFGWDDVPYAASTDETGLWVVGLILLVGGSFAGLVVLLTVSGLVVRRAGR